MLSLLPLNILEQSHRVSTIFLSNTAFSQNKFIEFTMLRRGRTHIGRFQYQTLFPLELRKATFSSGKQFISARHFEKFWISSQLSIRIERSVRFELKNT